MKRRMFSIAAILLALQFAPGPVGVPCYSPTPAAAKQHVGNIPQETEGDPDTFDDARPIGFDDSQRHCHRQVTRIVSDKRVWFLLGILITRVIVSVRAVR